MDSHVKVLGHPVHPMFIVFPLGLLSTAVILDVVQKATDDVRYAETAFFMIVLGLAAGAIAALAGLVDFLAIPARTRAKRLGAIHGIGNAVIVVLFAVALVVRMDADDHVANGLALTLQIAGIALALVTGWLGTELVERLGVGVDEDAGVNARPRYDVQLRFGGSRATNAVAGGTPSRTKVGGHAPHPLLVVYPLSLFPAAVIFDVLEGVTDDPRYGYAAFFSIAAGVIGGVVAAVPGLIDWLGVPANTRAKQVGRLHLIVNVAVLALFAMSWLVRWNADDRQPTSTAIALGAVGLAGSFLGGWLGGELHQRLGVGIDSGAHVDARSSLRDRAAGPEPYPTGPGEQRAVRPTRAGSRWRGRG
jgi:uncharacterized membrane protein